MPNQSGLWLIPRLRAMTAHVRIVVLTGFASIATAVEAIKLGAVHYLAKPVDADEVVSAFQRDEGDPHLRVSVQPLSVERMEWEHIQRVLSAHSGNISATARTLRMHRRTLQRKLAKRPVRD
jgi:two-component system response regulator RegA